MASRYRKIDVRIWNDEKFRALRDDSKLVFLFFLSHPALISIGAMRATLSGLAEELQWKARKFRRAFAELLENGMVAYDEKALCVGLPNFLKYNAPESPNVVRSWEKQSDLVPECGLKQELLKRAFEAAAELGEGFAKAFREAFPEGFREGSSDFSVNLPSILNLNLNPNPNTATAGGTKKKASLPTSRKCRSRSGAAIQGIDSEDLRDTAAVWRWFIQNAESLRMDPANYSHFREVLSWAEESLGGEKPGGLFITLAKQYAAGSPPDVTRDAEDRAKVRHTEWSRSQATSNPIMQKLADQFAVPTGEPAA